MDVFTYIDSLAHSSPWTLYLLVFVFPFVQEDTAVIGTATLTAIGKLSLCPAVIALTAGLFFSDIWKYWIGWFALRNRKGKELSQKEFVLSLQNKVESFPFTALFAARFIPFTRIPTYVACGFFKISYPKFCLYIAITAITLVLLVFGAFYSLGNIVGEKLKWVLPLIGISFIILILSVHLTHLILQTIRKNNYD